MRNPASILLVVWILLVMICIVPSIPWNGLRKKQTPFYEAIMYGEYRQVKEYLNSGTDPNAQGGGPEESSTVHAALCVNKEDVAELLVSRGSNLES